MRQEQLILFGFLVTFASARLQAQEVLVSSPCSEISSPSATATNAPLQVPKNKSLYQKKTSGKLYLEFVSGITKFNMDQIADLVFLGRQYEFSYRDRGWMVGGEIGTQTGFMMLGVRITNSNFSA